MKKKFKKRWIVIPSLIILTAFILFQIFKPKELPPKIVQTTRLSKGDVESLVEVQGNVTAEDSAEITSPYNYEVIQINVKEGDTVSKGQVLAVLDSSNLQEEIALLQKDIESDVLRVNEAYDSVDNIYKSTENLNLNIENAKKALDNAKIALDNAKSSYNNAIATSNDKKDLFEAGAIPQVEYEQSKIAVEQAKTLMEQSKIAYEQTQVSYQQAEEGLKRGQHEIQSAIDQATPKQSTISSIEGKKMSLSQKRNKLNKLQITSPIKGTVTRVYAKLGRYAQDTENHKAMFIIEDDSKKYVTAKVGEYDISRIKEGQSVNISAEVLEKDNVKGIVNRISPTGEKSQSGNNIVVPVKILVTQNDPRLITGVTAKAKISIQTAKNVFKIPFEALMTQDGKDFFYTIDEQSKLKKIEVTKGLEADFDTQISSKELKEDMIVVTNPDETFVEGDKVMDEKDMKKAENDKNNKDTKGNDDKK